MGFRFFRRMKIAPGVSINLSKSGASLSLGPRGAKVTAGPRGVRATAGLPGTGMYYTTTSSARKPSTKRSRETSPSSPSIRTERPEDRLSMGFFKRLVTPKGEEHFVDGMRQFVLGNEAAAFNHFTQATDLVDAAFMAGILALKREDFKRAEVLLQTARKGQTNLGRYFGKYGIQAAAELAITEQVKAIVSPDIRGVLLALAEVHQHQGQWKKAIGDLKQLYQRDPSDIVVRLSLAELAIEEAGDKQSCKWTIQLTEGLENESEIHAALLLFKAKALRLLGLLSAARDTLTATLRRKKGRSDELLRAVRYERALVYELLGKKRQARTDFEKLYAEKPGFEDVADRLGLLS